MSEVSHDEQEQEPRDAVMNIEEGDHVHASINLEDGDVETVQAEVTLVDHEEPQMADMPIPGQRRIVVDDEWGFAVVVTGHGPMEVDVENYDADEDRWVYNSSWTATYIAPLDQPGGTF